VEMNIYLLVGSFVVLLILGAILKSFQDDEDDGTQDGGRIGFRKFYRKTSVLSPAERRFFETLRKMVGNRAMILPQVRLGSVIGASSGSIFGTNDMINRKSVDFVLAKEDFSVLVVIELDDSSHTRHKRIARDKSVDSMLKSAGVPIVHVPVRSTYDEIGLEWQLNEFLKADEK
jgi:hypothetical protein